MNNPIHESQFEKQYEADRGQAIKFGGAVYTGGVIAATIIFLSFVLTAFPETAFFIRFLMIIAGLAVGASGIAFPVALHKWAIGGTHRTVTMSLYYGEIFIVGLNTIVSFAALLYKFAGNTLPDWVAWYEPFTIFSLVYVIFSWGTVFITDPHSQAKNKEKEALEQIFIDTANSMRQYINSNAGKLATQSLAQEKLRELFDTRSRNPFDNLGIPCAHCGVSNPVGTRFCSQCGAPTAPQAPAPNQPPARIALPSAPSLFTPAAAPSYRAYTLDELLAFWGMSREQARQFLDSHKLYSSKDAFRALSQAGYIPQDFGSDSHAEARFASLWSELFFPQPAPLPPRGPVTYYATREDYLKRQETDEQARAARKENGDRASFH